jgi:hypothetical protein
MATFPRVDLLATILSVDHPWDARDAIEGFMLVRLARTRSWSDGISEVRAPRREPDHVLITGRIWSLDDQIEHEYCLELRYVDDLTRIAWRLRIDVDAEASRLSPRRARNAIYVISSPDDVEWKIAIDGVELLPSNDGERRAR